MSSGSHRFPRVKHDSKAVGGYLHLGPRRQSRSLNDLIGKPKIRLDSGLHIVLLAPVDKGHKRRLEAQPAEEIIDVVADFRGQLTDLPPDSRQITFEVIPLVAFELFKRRIASVDRVRKSHDFEAVA